MLQYKAVWSIQSSFDQWTKTRADPLLRGQARVGPTHLHRQLAANRMRM
jgi:hypothetical protein